MRDAYKKTAKTRYFGCFLAYLKNENYSIASIACIIVLLGLVAQ